MTKPSESQETEKYPWWNRFLKEGETLYSFMRDNFETMIDANHIRHFDIIHGVVLSELFSLKNDHISSIEEQLVLWIRNEHICGRLFDRVYWTPFSDAESVLDMFLGYRKFFTYREGSKEHFLQLALEKSCRWDSACTECAMGLSGPISPQVPHFTAAYYGWKEGDSDYLQPCGNLIINPNDMKIPEKYWDI